MMVRELVFEMKAQPSEKLKTPEEVAREEREKLQKLEVSIFASQDSCFIFFVTISKNVLSYLILYDSCYNRFPVLCFSPGGPSEEDDGRSGRGQFTESDSHVS